MTEEIETTEETEVTQDVDLTLEDLTLEDLTLVQDQDTQEGTMISIEMIQAEADQDIISITDHMMTITDITQDTIHILAVIITKTMEGMCLVLNTLIQY